MAIRRKRIREMVTRILEESRTESPPIGIELLARNHGLEVLFQPLESDLSGFLYRKEGRAIIGVNSHHATVRQRFTIAHELGHYLLHNQEGVHVDRAVFARLRDSVASQGTDSDEIEANVFAAELLMPRAFIDADLKTMDVGKVDIVEDGAVGNLAGRYAVSGQAMLLRLRNLGYIAD